MAIGGDNFYNFIASYHDLLTISMQGNNVSRRHFEILFLFFFRKIGLGISCKLSPKETICMQCQTLLFGKNKNKVIEFIVCKISAETIEV